LQLHALQLHTTNLAQQPCARLTFWGASGCVVALRLPDAKLGRKGLGLLLVLALLLLGSCDSVCRAVLLAAWLLLSNVDGNPL
jgi:hypothetical protein